MQGSTAAQTTLPPWNEVEPVHPAVADARQILLLERHERDRRYDPSLLPLRQAVLLAPTLTICEHLLRGEHIPLSQLDPHWVTRFGLRHNEAA